MTQHCSRELQLAPSPTLGLSLPYSVCFYKIESLLPALLRRKLGPPE